MRKPFAYQDFLFNILIFQVLTSYSEELFFRGSLQGYLGARFGRSIVGKLVAALLISIPFGLIHGANPILFNQGSFDVDWFIGTFSLSILAGCAYAFTDGLETAFGVHIGHNLISSFF